MGLISLVFLDDQNRERAYIKIVQAELFERVVQSGFDDIRVELAIWVVSVTPGFREERQNAERTCSTIWKSDG